MTDEILKAYGKRTLIDEFLEVIDFDPEIGFNPYVWIPRQYAAKMAETTASPAVLRYREIMKKIHKERMSEQMLIGQSFGL